MPKPPPSGAHSDIRGVNMDARVNTPSRDPAKGTAASVKDAEKQSKGRPKDAGKLDKPES